MMILSKEDDATGRICTRSRSLVLGDGELVRVGFSVPRERVVISDQRRRRMPL